MTYPSPIPPSIMMKHFTACKIQFSECRRHSLFSCVMTILTSWKGLCGYDRDDMSCQDFCTGCLLRLFHPITPSVSSMWVLLSSTYVLYFLVIYFFVMITLIGNTIMRVLSYSVDRKPLHFPLIVHYQYMSCVCASTKTIDGFWRLWSMGFKLLKKHNFISLSNDLYSSTSDAEPGKAYRWRGAPVPCVCWYMYLQTSSHEIIVSRPHTLPMSVWYDFHWHHLPRNRCL